MMRAFVIVVTLAVLGVGGYFGYLKFEKPVRVTYVTAEVLRRPIVSNVSATGNIEPVVKVLVGSQVSGTVTRWFADFNQRVEADFVLATLDQDRYKAELDQKSAALAVAKARAEEAAAQLNKAVLERKRVEQAFEKSAASDFELQTARTAEDAARATLHAAEAGIESAAADQRLAAIQLDKTVIHSPIAGVVISRDVDEGQTVAASLSAPTLFTIANDLTKMRVNAAVSETDIGNVREGMEADFRVDAYPDKRFRGVVTQVRYAETIVDNVVTYPTIIDVDNPDLLLRPGMTATILFEVAKVAEATVVPNAALRFSPGAKKDSDDWMRPARGAAIQPRVYRLVNGALNEVKLELGLNDGTFTEVRSGDVKPGERVVVEEVSPRGSRGGGPPQQRVPRMM